MNNETEIPDEIPEPPKGSLIMRVKITEIPDEPEVAAIEENI